MYTSKQKIMANPLKHMALRLAFQQLKLTPNDFAMAVNKIVMDLSKTHSHYILEFAETEEIYNELLGLFFKDMIDIDKLEAIAYIEVKKALEIQLSTKVA